ncbi:MAG: alpha/beta fold hydrolase [Pirellulales bacterium]
MAGSCPKIEYYDACGCRRLAVRTWAAQERARARVVFVHGITSHGGWYGQCTEYLAARGFDVAFLDRRGSGLNGDSMGDIGRWTTWIDDVVNYVRPDSPSAGVGSSAHEPDNKLPTILCGISWGGKLATAVARRIPGQLAGLVTICPGLYSPFSPGPLQRLVLALPAPKWLQRRRLRVPLRDPALFTDSPHWCEFIARDPLALRTITWRFAQEDRKLTRYARDAAGFLRLPTLMFLAGQDRIVDNRRTRDFFGRIASNDKTLLEYHGAGHTLEFETDPAQYFHNLAEWIDRVVESNIVPPVP